MPSVGLGGAGGGTIGVDLKHSKSKDGESSDDDDEHKRGKFKLPKFGFGFGSGKKSKGKKSKKEDSGSETSDGEGGRIKRTLKMPKFGIGIGGGVSGKAKGSKPDDDSGSETSDGEGGRIKRTLKMPKFGIGIGGGVSGKAKGSKPGDDSGSETSDGEGGRIKRKLKMPKFGFGGGLSGNVKGSKPDDDSGSETSDGEGGRIKRKLKTPKFGVGIGGGVSGKLSGDIKLDRKPELNNNPRFGSISGKTLDGTASTTEFDSDDLGLFISDLDLKTSDAASLHINDGNNLQGDTKPFAVDVPQISSQSFIEVESMPDEEFPSSPSVGVGVPIVEENIGLPTMQGMVHSAPDFEAKAGSLPSVDLASGATGNIGRVTVEPDTSTTGSYLADATLTSKGLPSKYSFGTTENLKSTSTDIDDTPLDSGMGTDEIENFIFKSQRSGRPSVSSSDSGDLPASKVTLGLSSSHTMVKETYTVSKKQTEVHSVPSLHSRFSGTSVDTSTHYSFGGSLPSGGSQTTSAAVTKTFSTKSSESEIRTVTERESRGSFGDSFKAVLDTTGEVKTSTSPDEDEIESTIGEMDARDIKKIIFTSSRKGRFSLPSPDERSAKISYRRSEGFQGRRPVSMDVLNISQAKDSSKFSGGVEGSARKGIKSWRSTPDVSIVEQDKSGDFTTFSEAKGRFSQLERPSRSTTSSYRPRSSENLLTDASGEGKTSTSFTRFTSKVPSVQPLRSSTTVVLESSALSTDADTSVADDIFGTASLKTQGSTTTQLQSGYSETRRYRHVYLKESSDVDVDLEGMKLVKTSEQKSFEPVNVSLGTRTALLSEKSLSSSSQVTATSSRMTTVTTQTQVRKVPGLSKSYPEMVDEEIRQVREASEKAGESFEEKRRHSWDKRREWMMSGSPPESTTSPQESSQERKKISLKERRRLILGQDDDDTSEKGEQS